MSAITKKCVMIWYGHNIGRVGGWYVKQVVYRVDGAVRTKGGLGPNTAVGTQSRECFSDIIALTTLL